MQADPAETASSWSWPSFLIVLGFFASGVKRHPYYGKRQSSRRSHGREDSCSVWPRWTLPVLLSRFLAWAVVTRQCGRSSFANSSRTRFRQRKVAQQAVGNKKETQKSDWPVLSGCPNQREGKMREGRQRQRRRSIGLLARRPRPGLDSATRVAI